MTRRRDCKYGADLSRKVGVIALARKLAVAL